jgi:transposase-like protein
VNVNLVGLIEQFRSEDKCRAYLEELRWPEDVTCPRCGSTAISRIHERNQFHCDGPPPEGSKKRSCGYQFSVTAGTLLHDSHLPLWKWFLATYLMLESKKGISAKQLQRTLGVSYKTAWYLAHRVRGAMGQAEDTPLRGIVEMDDTLVGGEARGMGKGYRGNKTVVIGAVQRGGPIRLKVTPNVRKGQVQRFVAANIHDDADAIYTDEGQSYAGVHGDWNTRRDTVNHSIGEYARGDVHSNTVESVWSLFKRGIIGSYHQLSVKHLPSYLDEIEWRHNGRDNPFLFRDTLLILLCGDPLPYDELIAKDDPGTGTPPVTALDPEGH